MRGAISLAVALSLPTMLNGRTFGQRSTLIFLAAVVVVVTLIGQGLTLAPLVQPKHFKRVADVVSPKRMHVQPDQKRELTREVLLYERTVQYSKRSRRNWRISDFRSHHLAGAMPISQLVYRLRCPRLPFDQ